MENNQEKQAQPLWYVLQTYAGYEKMVQSSIYTMIENNDLSQFIFDVVVPEEEELVEKNGKKKIVLRKKFPCYAFIKMIYTKHVWYMVTQTRGVTSFCGPQGRPLPLTEEEVKRNQLEKIDVEELGIAVGDSVLILSGPLKDFIGSLLEINPEEQTVKVSVSMFGKETSTELEFIQIAKIASE